MTHAPIATRSTGFGLGLRTPHYADFLARKQPLDWLEIITDNYLVEGGKPLAMLDAIRRDYPVAMHGVALSIGAARGLDLDYLRRVKALAQRIDPLWVSDHLCWTGPGPEQLHDLYPLPCTDASARHVIAQIRQAQDLLGRRLVLENVSSYLRGRHDAASEWQFLDHIAHESDCLLLVDVNNIYVNSVNHGFDALAYLQGLPAHRVQQIHLAGHADHGDHLIDTHDHPVAPAVWALYAHACERFGPVATMIERDDAIPPLATLIDELQQARALACNTAPPPQQGDRVAWVFPAAPTVEAAPVGLAAWQREFADAVLQPTVATPGGCTGRFGIYHGAYRVRLAQVLADTYAKTCLYLGTDLFDTLARQYAQDHPPRSRSLNRYGEAFVDALRTHYPANPELHELAQLDWDLRTRFDGHDAPALALADAQSDPGWTQRSGALHASAVLRTITTNVASLWNAIDADREVPPAQGLAQAATLAVWRRGLQPHFRTLAPGEAALLQAMHQGSSLDTACAALQGAQEFPSTDTLAAWLAAWLHEGLIAGDALTPSSACAP